MVCLSKALEASFTLATISNLNTAAVVGEFQFSNWKNQSVHKSQTVIDHHSFSKHNMSTELKAPVKQIPSLQCEKSPQGHGTAHEYRHKL